MTNHRSNIDFTRQMIKGIFFCKSDVNLDDCRKLVQDLGCTVLCEQANTLTIQAARGRLKELKVRYMAPEDDRAEISSRLKAHFDRILIGGNA